MAAQLTRARWLAFLANADRQHFSLERISRPGSRFGPNPSMRQPSRLAPDRLDAMMGTAEAVSHHWLQGGSTMSTTLKLVEHLLVMARRYQDLGQTSEALRVLTRLGAFQDLPGSIAEETQVRIAEIYLK